MATDILKIIGMWKAGCYTYEEAVTLIGAITEEARAKALAFPLHENLGG